MNGKVKYFFQNQQRITENLLHLELFFVFFFMFSAQIKQGTTEMM